MDHGRFDAVTRKLYRATTRRAGLMAVVTGMIGVPAAETVAGPQRRHEKLNCRNANSECASDDQCCSGSCVPKPEGGTGFRCAKRHGKKRKKKDHGGNGPEPEVCLALGEACWDWENNMPGPIPCCDAFCGYTKRNPPDQCETCLGDRVIGCLINEEDTGCCPGLGCQADLGDEYGECVSS